MPNISGRVAVCLSVTDADASSRWYSTVLGFAIERRFERGGVTTDVVMRHQAGLVLTLVQHSKRPTERFDERAPGLDHLEFLVESDAALDDWCERLTALGVSHSGVKRPAHSKSQMVTFRDPDNIQLELYWQGT